MAVFEYIVVIDAEDIKKIRINFVQKATAFAKGLFLSTYDTYMRIMALQLQKNCFDAKFK